MNIRTILLTACMTALLTTVASAQSTWQEYTYPSLGFAVSFPDQPTTTTVPFTAPDGTVLTETVYSVRQETGTFRMIVVDYAGLQFDGTTAINQAVSALQETGEIKVNIPARVQRTFGRYLNIAGNDGSHSIAAVFFGGNRLYEIEGTVPASNPDALSGEMIRFQQSLRFMGAAGRGGQPGFGRDGFQRRRGFRQNPPAPTTNP